MYTISASVGDGGQNELEDLRLIQMLLNRISSIKGGPNPKLVADGLIGPKTIDAIRAFQEMQQLPVIDGRIDPGGSAIARINALLVAPPSGLVPVAGLPDPVVPLDPGSGGRSIGLSALKPGDLIVSAGAGLISWGIRAVTSSAASHVMVYLGPDELGAERVAEALGPGLRYGYLTAVGGGDLSMDDEDHALYETNLAVALRCRPGLSPEQVNLLESFAAVHLGDRYDFIGVMLQPLFSLDLSSGCESLGATGAEVSTIVAHVGDVLGGLVDPLGISVDDLFAGLQGEISDAALGIAKSCYRWVGQIELNRETDNSLFCSEFVLAAYEAAGITLTSQPPHWANPQDIVEIYLRSQSLGYVGHLLA